jgi:RhtB (resistance to homoserine/threonine) family protein
MITQLSAYLPLIGTVTVINILGAVSPGPDFIVTVQNSIQHSRLKGFLTGLGVACGLLIHISYCAAGIGLIISTSPWLFSLFKIAGSSYLIWLGISSILSKSHSKEVDETGEKTMISNRKAFRTGLFTNLLNPKAMLFFLSLFTFVMNPMPPVPIVIICGAIIFLTAVVWFAMVSYFFTEKHIQKVFFRFEKTINSILGLILIYIGIRVLLMLFS